MTPSIWVYDLECSPNLCWTFGLWDQNIGINQIVESQDILTFAAHKIGTKKIETHAAWDNYDAMINRLHEVMCDADYLVGYNNLSYDDKMSRAAFVKAGLQPPSPHRAIDLMRVVKKNFRFPSNKLDYVTRALGLDHKMQTGGMELWTKAMAGDTAAQKKMLAYNKQDVKITSELFERLRGYIDGINLPLVDGTGEERPACTNCGGVNIIRKGTAFTNTTSYKRYVCTDCGKWLRSRKSDPLKTMLVGA